MLNLFVKKASFLGASSGCSVLTLNGSGEFTICWCGLKAFAVVLQPSGAGNHQR